MPVKIVMGAQAGDEGKGKIIDHLSTDDTIVSRYRGGANAGHNVQHHGLEIALHLVPSGISRENVTCVIANGVLVDPLSLFKEISELTSKGIHVSPRNLLVSDSAFVTMPQHRILDYLEDIVYKIGTTGAGMGPTAISQLKRTGIRTRDLLDKSVIREKIEIDKELVDMNINFLVKNMYRYFSTSRTPDEIEKRDKFIDFLNEYRHTDTGLNVEKIVNKYHELGLRLQPHMIDTREYLHKALSQGRNILGEGAQGALLDVNHGTYPYITISDIGPAGFISGTGLPYNCIDEVIAVVKLTSSKVGEGPFIGELGTYEDIRGKNRDILGLTPSEVRALLQKINEGNATPFEQGQYYRNLGVNESKTGGGEYGATTSRPRRMGTLDFVALEQVVKIHGISKFALTKLDALSGIDKIPVITSYKKEDCNIIPQYTTFAGFGDVSKIREYEKLPANARKLIEAIGEIAKVCLISVGPRDDQTIIMN